MKPTTRQLRYDYLLRDPNLSEYCVLQSCLNVPEIWPHAETLFLTEQEQRDANRTNGQGCATSSHFIGK